MTPAPRRRAVPKSRIVAVLAFGLLAACASRPRSYVVLVPEPDGSVGHVKLEGAGKTRELDQANQLAGFDAAEDTQALSDDEVRETFGSALDATPPEPERFVLLFRSNASRLDAKAEATLGEVLESVKRRTVPEVSVIGRADRAGPDEYNRKLAGARAERVSQALLRRGLAKERLEVFTLGEEKPIVPTKDGVREPKNRRVDVIVR